MENSHLGGSLFGEQFGFYIELDDPKKHKILRLFESTPGSVRLGQIVSH
jgi:hypothetical protein